MKIVELGVAGTIAVKQFIGHSVEDDINRWLECNSDVEVIDIKFATSASSDDWSTDALIIYRKED